MLQNIGNVVELVAVQCLQEQWPSSALDTPAQAILPKEMKQRG
jgi:hypothetical protein